ncbi:hypothetical protein DSECCO2_557600 [anaerobic digester metagenome]
MVQTIPKSATIGTGAKNIAMNPSAVDDMAIRIDGPIWVTVAHTASGIVPRRISSSKRAWSWIA